MSRPAGEADDSAPERPARETRLRVRYAETDQMGMVYHANYLAWFEVGRTDWIRQAGPEAACGAERDGERSYRRLEEKGWFLPVVEASSRYHRPARYDDEVRVLTRLVLATRARFEFEYEALREDGSLLATGRTSHALTDAKGRPRRLPKELLAWLLGEGPEPLPGSTARDA